MSIESLMASNHLILYHPLLLLPLIFPSIRVFSSELTLLIMWLKYWSFSCSNSPSMNTQGWFPLGLTGLISLQSKAFSRVFSNTTVQKHRFFGPQPSLWSNSPMIPYMTTGKTKVLTIWTYVGKVMSLLSNTLSRSVLTCVDGYIEIKCTMMVRSGLAGWKGSGWFSVKVKFLFFHDDK